jgi:SAM-dependent methyltransferase
LTAACELCGYSGEMTARFPKKQIVECPRCELVFYAGPLPESDLYKEEYFAGGEYLDYRGDRKVLQRNFARSIAMLRRLAPSGRLLELGSAYGFFLELAQSHWDVRGIDVSAEGARYAREAIGVDAREADFLALPDERESYDVICLWDTVEHLPHPVRTLEKAGRWLKPGGILALTTGDVESPLARWRGDRWRQVHPPTHLFYFSGRTLKRALENSGLEIREVSHVGYSRGSRAMLYGLLALGGKKTSWLYKTLTLGERLDFPVYLNLYDILMVVAQKPFRQSNRSRKADGQTVTDDADGKSSSSASPVNAVRKSAPTPGPILFDAGGSSEASASGTTKPPAPPR